MNWYRVGSVSDKKLFIVFKMQYQIIFCLQMFIMQGTLCHPCVDHPESCHLGHFSAELYDFIPDSSTDGKLPSRKLRHFKVSDQFGPIAELAVYGSLDVTSYD